MHLWRSMRWALFKRDVADFSPEPPHVLSFWGYSGENMNYTNSNSAFSICVQWLHVVSMNSSATIEKSLSHRKVYWRFKGENLPFWMWSSCIQSGEILEWSKIGDELKLKAVGTPYILDRSGNFRIWVSGLNQWIECHSIGLDKNVSPVRNLFLNTVECGIVFKSLLHAKR